MWKQRLHLEENCVLYWHTSTWRHPSGHFLHVLLCCGGSRRERRKFLRAGQEAFSLANTIALNIANLEGKSPYFPRNSFTLQEKKKKDWRTGTESGFLRQKGKNLIYKWWKSSESSTGAIFLPSQAAGAGCRLQVPGAWCVRYWFLVLLSRLYRTCCKQFTVLDTSQYWLLSFLFSLWVCVGIFVFLKH